MPETLKTFERDVELIITIAEEAGLDFFDIDFRICPAEMISLAAAYSIPTRFSHWSFGKRFRKRMLQHRFGISRIHELTFFSDPCQALVLENNSPLENKLIAAHVIAHSDFFKNNVNFSGARRNVTHMMECHRRFIEECAGKHGFEAVERLLDALLSIRWHIDPGYDPLEGERGLEKDLLLYIFRNSRSLSPWQKQILSMIREESCFFRPLQDTGFFNEGWAAYWHTRILRKMELKEAEAVEFAIINASALECNNRNINPYRLGVELISRIRKNIGDNGIFALRKEGNDTSFLREYLDKEMMILLKNNGRPRVTADIQRCTQGDLYLKHHFDGQSLKPLSVRKTLEQIYYLWGGKTFLETTGPAGDILYSFDGCMHSVVNL